jgi:hypothetical protein
MSAAASGLAKVNQVGAGDALAAAAAAAAAAAGGNVLDAVVAVLDRELLLPWRSGAAFVGELAQAVQNLSIHDDGRGGSLADDAGAGAAIVAGNGGGGGAAAAVGAAAGLGGRRTDPVWPPPSVPGTLRHVRQSRGWDCGLACVQMVAKFCASSAAAAAGTTFQDLRREVGTTSVWTIHLSTLLRARNVAHLYATTCAGINEELKSLLFYRTHIDKDQERVLALFDEARAAGVPIMERSFPVDAWQHALTTRRVVLILLVDTRALRCVVCGCFKRQLLTCGFTGHYVVVFAFDTDKQAFAYHDPGSVCEVCWMRPVDFDKARSAKGTDEDVIVCAY